MNPSRTPRRIAVLWFTLTGYMNAVLRQLAAQPGVDIFVADHAGDSKQAPFADETFAWMNPAMRYRYPTMPVAAELLPQLEAFEPDTILVASWAASGYRAICKAFAGRVVRVCGIDNQWEGSLKQRLGELTAPIFVQRLFDAVLVSGERQAVFARHLGFSEDAIWRGLYSADTDAFAYPGERTLGSGIHSFLYAGRLIADKGVDTLLEAYWLYRLDTEKAGLVPWDLRIVGSGNLALIEGRVGVQHLGFVQPADLPNVFAAADCFVLPSRRENWGVVLHEAAAASLPIICTTACGSSVHMVCDGYNGLLVGKDNPRSLADAMVTISDAPAVEYNRMAGASASMAQQLTPTRWAQYFLQKSEVVLQRSSIRF